MNFRERMKSGWGRGIFSLLAFISAAAIVFFLWEKFIAWKIDFPNTIQKVAFVAAAFSVTAYNLRVRVVDVILKTQKEPHQMKILCRIARNCGNRLTFLVIIFTFSALAMGGAGFIPALTQLGKWASMFVSGLFAFSSIHFIYVLFAFERLEDFLLSDAESQSEQREIQRLTQSAKKS